MRESFRGLIGGLLAAGGVAAGSGEAIAASPAETVEHHEERESLNLLWAKEAEAAFDVAHAAGDHDAMADVLRAFIREYHFPTQGKIVRSNQDNPMRILNKGEWRQLRDVVMHFMTVSSAWGKEYPNIQRQIADVMERIDTHIDEPGPVRGRGIPIGEKGDIDRSLGY